MIDNKHFTQQMWESNTALKRLAGLVGTWQTEISMQTEPPIVVVGQAVVEPLAGEPFLIIHDSVEHPDFPRGTMVIGGDDATGEYSMLYFDSRGVARIYDMSLSDEVWELRRDFPGFPQRFICKFSNDGNTITGRWEKSTDGSTWEIDFHLTYRRQNHGK